MKSEEPMPSWCTTWYLVRKKDKLEWTNAFAWNFLGFAFLEYIDLEWLPYMAFISRRHKFDELLLRAILYPDLDVTQHIVFKRLPMSRLLSTYILWHPEMDFSLPSHQIDFDDED